MNEQEKSVKIREALREACIKEADKHQMPEEPLRFRKWSDVKAEIARKNDPYVEAATANPERADNGCMIYRGLKP